MTLSKNSLTPITTFVTKLNSSTGLFQAYRFRQVLSNQLFHEYFQLILLTFQVVLPRSALTDEHLNKYLSVIKLF